MANDERVQMLVRMDPAVHAWINRESAASGRSATWLVEHACKLWMNRIERSRSQRAKARSRKR